MGSSVVLEGRGLHTGARARVRLLRAPGEPIALVQGRTCACVADLVVVASERSTTVADATGALRVATVEHLFAAFAGLGVRDGVRVEVDGPEIPLLDGGALAFATALASVAPPGPVAAPVAPAGLHVARAGEVRVGESTYRFAPAAETRVDVAVTFEAVGRSARASWDGTKEAFVASIAPARTFGLEHEVAALVDRGLASHVAPESVVVLGRDHVLSAGRPFEDDEPARHKLLDLLGDLFLHGGPPRGVVEATRPGHAATHAAVARALASGLLGPPRA